MTKVAINQSERAAIRDRFLQLDTATVADVLDEFGYRDQGLAADFSSRAPAGTKLAGWAFTIQGKMMPYTETGDPKKIEACDSISPNEVTVWGGDGEGICYFGELIATGLQKRGCSGALIDGGIRDLRFINEIGFPVFARYQTPIQSIGRWKVVTWQQPVYLRGATTKLVTVESGDFVLGDEDGVIVVPAGTVDDVLRKSEQLDRDQEIIRTELSAGLTLRQALAKYGHL